MRLFKHAFARLRTALAALAVGTLALAAQAGTTEIYYHNDLAGTPMAATDGAGNLLWRQSYKPYGERLEPKAPAEQLPWYTGKAHVEAAGLSYFGARWYDPGLGRFMGVDPVGFSEANVHSFNRYAYANNNPYKFVDPDGKQAVPALVPPGRAMMAPPPALAGRPSEQQQARQLEGFGAGSSVPNISVPALGIADLASFAIGGVPGLVQGIAERIMSRSGDEGKISQPDRVIVDSRGNAIPLNPGETLTGSRDGKWLQVRDAEGNATGMRIDGAHSTRTHSDPRALAPHAHVPGVKNPDGTPWLPIK